jgi:ceramide glucosyltransferase
MTPAHIAAFFGWALTWVALIGALYTLVAAVVVASFFAGTRPPALRSEAVTLLKPLYGDEPHLFDNLAGFLTLDHDGPIQLLLGLQRADDPAITVIERLRAKYPAAQIDLVVDSRRHGANGKIANLINMVGQATHPILILSDSDIAVAPDYLARLLAALDVPGVGAVTAAYVGRGDAGFWSRFGAAGLDWHLLPGVIFGAGNGLATPCMGSTIALRAETLAAIGGFEAFADTLADDYAIGRAILALGQNVVVPPMLVIHAGSDATFADLWRHEVRWGATILGVEPIGYTAGVIAMPVPVALLATALLPTIGGWVLLLALASRFALITAICRVSGRWPVAPLLLPARDILTFTGFIASFFARSVDWRGSTLKMGSDGQVSKGPENSA